LQKGFEPGSAFYIARAAEMEAIDYEEVTADGRVSFFRLEEEKYVEISSSVAFPPLTAEMATKFVEDRKRLDNIVFDRLVRDWAHRQ